MLYVNGQAISPEHIAAEQVRLRPEYERCFAQMESEAKQRQLEDWARENIIEAVLLRQAARQQMVIDPQQSNEAYQRIVSEKGGAEKWNLFLAEQSLTEQQARQDIDSELQTQMLIQKIESSAAKPGEKQIRQFYHKHVDRFTVPQMFRASHIVKHPSQTVSKEEQKRHLEGVLSRLKEGEDFSALASQFSDCPERGGDLGCFVQGQMVDAFEAAVLTLEPGQVSDIFETEFGLHIAKLTDKRPPRPCPIEQVCQVIEEELSREHKQKAMELFLDSLRSKAVIEEK